MLSAIVVCVLPCIAVSESMVSPSSMDNVKRSMHVARNGLVSQQLAVDVNHQDQHQQMRREQKLTSGIASRKENLKLGVNDFASTGFGYGRSQWNYGNQDEWFEVVNNAELCKANRAHSMQSPIAIDDSKVNYTDASASAPLVSLYDRYTAQDVDAPKMMSINNGHTLKVEGRDGQSIVPLGQLALPDGSKTAQYVALQFHFHKAVEHIINGNSQYLMEMQIVHQKSGSSGTDDVAVVSVMLQMDSALGGPRNIERQVKNLDNLRCMGDGTLPRGSKECEVCSHCKINLKEIFGHELQGQYYHYEGSLTSPPCAEGVHWYVLQRPAAVNQAFLDAFGEVFPSPGNSRAVQARNGRWITMNNVTNPPRIVVTTTDDHEFKVPEKADSYL